MEAADCRLIFNNLILTTKQLTLENDFNPIINDKKFDCTDYLRWKE